MFAVTVVFQVNPQDIGQFMSLMVENARTSVQDEPGCHQFDVCTDQDRPGEVILYEIYDAPAAFDANKQTDHYKVFDSAVGPLVRIKTVRTYSTVAQ